MNTVLFMRYISAAITACISLYSYISYQVFVENTFVKNQYTNIQIYETIGIIGNNIAYMPTIIMLFAYTFRPIAAYISNRYDQKAIITYSIMIMISTLLILGAMPQFSMSILSICFALQASILGLAFGRGYISSYNEAMKSNQNPNYSISILYVASFIGSFIGRFIARSFHMIYIDYIMNPVYQDWFMWRLPFLFSALFIMFGFWITYILSCKMPQCLNSDADITENITDDYVLLDKDRTIYRDEYTYLTVYNQNRIYKYILYVGIYIVCALDSVIFRIMYVGIANDKAQFNTTGFPAFFWTFHQIATAILLPFAGRFIDALNKRYPSMRNLLGLSLCCISFIIFGIGLLYDLWPNIFLSIVALLCTSLYYSTFIVYILERTSPLQYNIMMIIHQISMFSGSFMFAFRGTIAHLAFIFFPTLILIFMIGFYVIERRYIRKYQYKNIISNNQ